MIAVLGGLGAAVAWAISTVCSSRSSRLIHPLSVVAWMMVVGLVTAAPAAAISGLPHGLHGSALAFLVAAGVGNLVGLALEYFALRVGQVGVVAPLISTEGAITALIAVVVGETLAPGVGVALVVIAIGVCLASVPAAGPNAPIREHHQTSVVLAVLTALTFGASLYAASRAGAELPSSWVALSARVVGALGLALPLALQGRLEMAPGAGRLVVTSGVCEVLGFYSFIWGSRHGIAIAAVVSSQFAALSAIAAYVLFGERLSRIQLTGVVTVIVGVAVLSGLQA